MDYTTLERVKLEAIKTGLNTDDDLIEILITSASRAIDRKITGSASVANYFLMEDVANEVGRGIIDKDGNLMIAPHKSVVNSIAAMSYRTTPAKEWTLIEEDLYYPDEQFAVAWGVFSGSYPGKVFFKISYNGGLAEEVDDLPADLVELATMLATRYYKEAETGLTDAIGVAELGTIIYTKAGPVRAMDMLQPFMRVVPWRVY